VYVVFLAKVEDAKSEQRRRRCSSLPFTSRSAIPSRFGKVSSGVAALAFLTLTPHIFNQRETLPCSQLFSWIDLLCGSHDKGVTALVAHSERYPYISIPRTPDVLITWEFGERAEMFMIQPKGEFQGQTQISSHDTSMASQGSSTISDFIGPARVSTACDSCRVRKAKASSTLHST
jgi:hypothetical protein